MIIKILILLTHAISYILIWYHNRWDVCSVFERPPIFRGLNKTLFTLVLMLLHYGSVIGIFFALGLWYGIGAFILGRAVNAVLNLIYFKQARDYYEIDHYERSKKRAEESGLEFDSLGSKRSAREFAESAIKRNLET